MERLVRIRKRESGYLWHDVAGCRYINSAIGQCHTATEGMQPGGAVRRTAEFPVPFHVNIC